MPAIRTQSLMGDYSYQIVLSSVEAQSMLTINLLIVLLDFLLLGDVLELFEQLSFFEVG